MRRLSLAALSAVVFTLTPLPAHASHEDSHEPTSDAVKCTAALDLIFEPGLSLTPSKGTFKTDKPGIVECAGLLQGQEVSGPGTLALSGNYGQSSDAGDTCSFVLGTGSYSLTLPTRGGPVSEKGQFAEVLGPTREGSFSAVSEDRRWGGTFEFSPRQGDCVLAPITAAQITLEFEGSDGSSPSTTVGVSGRSGLVAVTPHDVLDAGPGPAPGGTWRQFRPLTLSDAARDVGNIVGDYPR